MFWHENNTAIFGREEAFAILVICLVCWIFPTFFDVACREYDRIEFYFFFSRSLIYLFCACVNSFRKKSFAFRATKSDRAIRPYGALLHVWNVYLFWLPKLMCFNKLSFWWPALQLCFATNDPHYNYSGLPQQVVKGLKKSRVLHLSITAVACWQGGRVATPPPSWQFLEGAKMKRGRRSRCEFWKWMKKNAFEKI
jgi:hypothetical protein